MKKLLLFIIILCLFSVQRSFSQLQNRLGLGVGYNYFFFEKRKYHKNGTNFMLNSIYSLSYNIFDFQTGIGFSKFDVVSLLYYYNINIPASLNISIIKIKKFNVSLGFNYEIVKELYNSSGDGGDSYKKLINYGANISLKKSFSTDKEIQSSITILNLFKKDDHFHYYHGHYFIDFNPIICFNIKFFLFNFKSREK